MHLVSHQNVATSSGKRAASQQQQQQRNLAAGYDR